MARLVTHFEVLRFALVGAVGFLVDGGVLSLLALSGWSLYVARVISFSLAVSCTYILHGWLTFEVKKTSPVAERTTAVGYGLIQVVGALVNLVIFSALIWQEPQLSRWPWAPLAASAAVGLAFNYTLSSILFGWRARHGQR